MNHFDPEIIAALLYIGAAIGLGVVLLVLIRVVTRLLKTGKKAPHKYDTYECGVPQLGNTRERFSVKFYLVALLFVLFDIETVFLLPYAVVYKKLANPAEGFWSVMAFVAILGVGLYYIVKRRALEWDLETFSRKARKETAAKHATNLDGSNSLCVLCENFASFA